MKTLTEKKLMDALERLLKGQPENQRLRLNAKEGALKITKRCVEIEAECSPGAIRNYPCVIAKIDLAHVNSLASTNLKLPNIT